MMHFRRHEILTGLMWRPRLRDRCLALIVVCAFFFQALIVQTHIHNPAAIAGIAAAFSGKSNLLSPQRAPDPLQPKDNAANCPLCEAGILNGTFVAPAAIVILPLIPFVALKLAASEILTLSFRHSHSWQGRAPPRI